MVKKKRGQGKSIVPLVIMFIVIVGILGVAAFVLLDVNLFEMIGVAPPQSAQYTDCFFLDVFCHSGNVGTGLYNVTIYPMALLIYFAAIGAGFIGGYLGYDVINRSLKKKWLAILIGIIAGFASFWLANILGWVALLLIVIYIIFIIIERRLTKNLLATIPMI